MKSVRQANGQSNETARRLTTLEVIRLDDVYSLCEARARLGWTISAYRAAKRRGLRVLKCGKRQYICGREILRFLEDIQPSE